MTDTAAPYPKYKLAIFALLVANALYYGVADTLGRTIDAASWLALLVLFELETEFGWHDRIRRSTRLIHLARLFAIAGATVAAILYVVDFVALDIVNAALWLAIIVLLEWEVRFPQQVARVQRPFLIATASLYAGLVALVLTWAWQGAWFDAYDALLWIIAYAAIEMDVFKFSQKAVAAD